MPRAGFPGAKHSLGSKHSNQSTGALPPSRRIEALRAVAVHHEARRTGRPYTLVLMKTNALVVRERRSRALDQRNLAWLLAALDEH